MTKKQTKSNSLKEAIASVGVGLLVNFSASFVIFPLFGLTSTFFSNLGVTLCYTGLAIARTYFVRRYFEQLGK